MRVVWSKGSNADDDYDDDNEEEEEDDDEVAGEPHFNSENLNCHHDYLAIGDPGAEESGME